MYYLWLMRNFVSFNTSLFGLILPLLICCSTSRPTGKDDVKTVNQRSLVAQISKEEPTSDPFTIENVELNGNNLRVKVSYAGGCGNHDFSCLGSKALSKSMPPQRSFRIIHKANEDTCKKRIEEELLIDLKALTYQQTQGSEIVLHLEGWKESIRYIYQ
jgi:hypothetical protein